MLVMFLIFIPFVGIILTFVEKLEKNSWIIGLITSIVNFYISLVLFILFDFSNIEYQFVQEVYEFTSLNIYLGLDGLSLYFLLLTTFITPIVIVSNWHSIEDNIKTYIIIILLLETLLVSVFLVLNILLFYIFFESILMPLFILIGLYGSSNKVRASFYLFLYTLLGSLFLLLSILLLLSLIGSTDFDGLFKTNISYSTQLILFIGIFIALAVKTPVIFLNTWLLKAHVESPLGGSIILAAIVLKLSLYGVLRLILPIIPKASLNYTYIVYTIGIITIIYASISTLRTIDIKELIAYSSVSHAAVYLLGVFSNTIQGIQGGILLGLGHGFVSSGLFICAGGILYDRSHTRLITIYRGLVQVMPLFSILFFILCLSNAGTPLSLNFIGEFLSLYGIFERLPFLGIFASSSIVLSAAYTMYMFNRIVFGGKYSKYLSFNLVDLSKREYLILIVLVLLTVLLGIYPSIILDGLHYNVSELMYNSNIDYSIDMCTAPLVVICYKTYKYEEKYDFNYLYLSIETVLYSGLFISSMLPGLIPENIDGLVYVPEIIPKCINPILNQLHAMNIDIHDLIIGGAAVCNVFPFFRLINFSNHTQQHVIDLSSQSPMAIKEFLEIPAGYVWDSTRSHYIREVEFSNTERTVEITVKPGIICTPDPANPDNIHFKLTSQSMHIHFPRGAIVTGTPEYRTILATI